jgi:ring-1,2-phenylacetyl-CoA epoxidase subunit PaaE
MRFYALTIKKIVRLTSESIVISLEVPRLLRRLFVAEAGQYITLKVELQGESFRRSYSLCAPCVDGSELQFAVKRVAGGAVSPHLVGNLVPGGELEVAPPDGRFVIDYEPALATKRVFVAAGSGITPIVAQIETVLEREPRSKVLLVYSNRALADMMFRQKLHVWEQEYEGRFFQLHFITGSGDAAHEVSIEFPNAMVREGRTNWMVVDETIRKYLEHPALAHYYLCGPDSLIEQGRDFLFELNIPRARVLYEYFTSTRENNTLMSTQSVDAVLRVTIDGEEHTVSVPAGKTILESVIAAGLDAPYSCRSGICTTCMAVAEGSFDTSKNIALGPDDFEQGYILTCSTLCTSETGSVNYDEA